MSVGLWFPPGLRSDDAPPDPDPATPTEHPDGYTPTLAMKYAILAALNDAAARPAILIDPWRNAEKKTAGGAWYDSLRTWAKALNLEGDGEWTGKLVLWFEDVQTEIERMLPAGMSHLDSLELNGAGMAQTVKENAAKPEAAGKGAGGSDDVLKGEAKALALLVAHPEWSNTQIAKAVPCNLRTLHKWKLFKQARAALKSTRATVAHGSKDRKTHRVEAWGGDDD
ncbi:MAG: hypothetical protein IT449_05160 [Phycisphaerales bacterium]|nr:hypothetical protein [Phycisphaerales bacterium]